MSEQKDDRFNITWEGPYDPRALNWAVEHNMNFETGNGTAIRIGSQVIYRSGPSSIDTVALLRSENKKSNDEARALHARDTGLDTGTNERDFGDGMNWGDRTRGQKLRKCKKQIAAFEGDMKKGRDEYEGMKERGEVDEEEENQQRKVVTAVAKLIDGWKEMETLVEKEVEEGWDWRVGIGEQSMLMVKVIRLWNEGIMDGAFYQTT